jgi:hypothetical protein
MAHTLTRDDAAGKEARDTMRPAVGAAHLVRGIYRQVQRDRLSIVAAGVAF